MLPTLAFYTVLAATSITLPDGPPIGMDYLAYDAVNHRVWVPAGNTGKVDVIDVPSGKLTPIAGFVTSPNPRAGRPKMGPSSATVADGVVWIGNRGDNTVCSFDGKTLAKRTCIHLASMPDGLAYASATREIWVTTPRDQTITIVAVGGKTPAASSSIKLEGDPEGYAIDAARGIFFTNLEDKNRTLAIDLKSHEVVANWTTGCDSEGPRGLAIDVARKLLFVACSNGASTLDLGHDGKLLGHLKTGDGVDNIDYRAETMMLYVASGKDATLTIAKVSEAGALSVSATAPTAAGARNPVVDGDGTAYVADSQRGRVIIVKPAP